MKKNLKKLLAIGLAASFAMSGLTGCGAKADPQANELPSDYPEGFTAAEENSAAEEVSAEASVESTVEAATEASSEAEVASEVADLPIEELEMKDITPAKLVSEIKAGWNLGNSLDCYGKSGLEAETYWSNPKTTKEMIDAVAAKGFNSIRIPITWADHMSAAPDYSIDPDWMARVKEVVDYCIEDDLYVIIDTHHEETWRIPDDAHINEVCQQSAALWAQIATEFKDYDYHLIFEGNNEPRVKGGDNEWNGGTSEVRNNLDTLNQLFVDTVRSTGDNNEYRLLLLASVANAPVIQTIAPLKIPEDDHIAVSIHAYTPYAFTYEDPSANPYDNWDGSHKSDIASMFQDVDRILLQKGIPVLLTEYGAVDKHNEDEVVSWVTEYLTRANKYGIPCYWWDNGNFDQEGEKFAIFNRNDCTWYREKVADAIISVSNERE
jgi:endoglucanase